MADKPKVYFIRVPEDVYKEIGALADADDRSINSMAVRVLKLYIEVLKVEKKNLKTGVSQKTDAVKTLGNPPEVMNVIPETVEIADVTPEKNISGATPESDVLAGLFSKPALVGEELPCCMNPTQPCKHWSWDGVNLSYVNSLSGRRMEVE